MDEEDLEYEEESLTWSRKLQKADIFVLGFNLAAGIADAFAETLRSAQGLVAAHANYNFDQQQFHQEAALEIETLIAGETEDG